MIRNEQQLRVATKKLRGLEAAIHESMSPGERESFERLASRVRYEIHEYAAIKQGAIIAFRVKRIDDLPDALVKARIAEGLTQKELAERLGVTEQMVQRDEAGGYETASLDRLADAADALDYTLEGTLHPRSETEDVYETRSLLNLSLMMPGPIEFPLPTTTAPMSHEVVWTEAGR